jgi:hypothetical protein
VGPRCAGQIGVRNGRGRGEETRCCFLPYSLPRGPNWVLIAWGCCGRVGFAVSIQIRIGNAGKNGGNRAREEWKAAGVERGKTYERGRVAGAARDFFILVSLKN